MISIHAPREGGDDWNRPLVHVNGISIHAPREGGDPHNYYLQGGLKK